MVVLGELSLALEDLDEDTRLVVGVGGENLGLLDWDGAVSVDQVGHDASGSLDTEGQWGHIEQDDILDGFTSLLGEDSGLDGGSVSDGLIRVDGFVWLLSVEVLSDELLNLWDSGGSTDQHDIVDLVLAETGILEDVLDWDEGVLEVVEAELLELGSG